jgi:UDP-2-acetamido-3-amino-2,3-dideoxy-glucuronate N-acetyltransferase
MPARTKTATRPKTNVKADYFVHPSAFVDKGAVIGNQTKIWHFCHVMPGAQIGRGCILGQNVFVSSTVVIGNNVKIQNNVSVYDAVTLEDDVFCGPSMVFTNVINPRSHIERKHEYKKTLVKRGASIGANATIICGTTVGEYSFVAAGAVVRNDVPAHALVAGVPAVQKGWMCSCGVKLDAVKNKLSCGACKQVYQLTAEGLIS